MDDTIEIRTSISDEIANDENIANDVIENSTEEYEITEKENKRERIKELLNKSDEYKIFIENLQYANQVTCQSDSWTTPLIMRDNEYEQFKSLVNNIYEKIQSDLDKLLGE